VRRTLGAPGALGMDPNARTGLSVQCDDRHHFPFSADAFDCGAACNRLPPYLRSIQSAYFPGNVRFFVLHSDARSRTDNCVFHGVRNVTFLF
jgi:hypothetical protein